jgi:hypothetical protein
MSIHQGVPALFDFSGRVQNCGEQDREAEVTRGRDHESELASEFEAPGPRRYGLAQAIWTLYQAGLVEDPPAR